MNLRRCLIALPLLALPGCAGSRPGECSIIEPGSSPQGGISAYTEHVTPTPGGFGVGSLAVTITCGSAESSSGDLVVLILPNLTRSAGPPTGRFRVRNPNDTTMTPAELRDPRLAWARVARGGAAPVLFTGQGGEIVLTHAGGGTLEGAYQVALAPAADPVALPGGGRETDAAFAPGEGARTLIAPTVLGGAFYAHRHEADWRER